MDSQAEAHLDLNPFWGRPLPSAGEAEDALEFHRRLPGYEPTPLVACPSLAARLGIRSVHVKDESQRFGLNSFKALGPSYALPHLLASRAPSETTVVAASEGNHGLALAWAAAGLGCEAIIYMGVHVEEWRRQAIRDVGARVHIVDGSYDDAVRRAALDAEKNGWISVADTAVGRARGGASEVVRGYTTLFREVRRQLVDLGEPDPTLVLLQGGVGGLAAAGVQVLGGTASGAILVTVEPLAADCLRAGILTTQGLPRPDSATGVTAMSCLNCGRPSDSAWPWIRAGVNALMAVDDAWAFEGVRFLEDLGIGTEPSGAAGLAGLLALLGHPGLEESRRLLQCGAESRVLIVNTEGRGVRLEPRTDLQACEVA